VKTNSYKYQGIGRAAKIGNQDAASCRPDIYQSFLVLSGRFVRFGLVADQTLKRDVPTPFFPGFCPVILIE